MPKIIATGRIYVCEYWSDPGRWFIGQAYFQSPTQLKVYWTNDWGYTYTTSYTLPPGTSSSYPPNVWPAAEQLVIK